MPVAFELEFDGPFSKGQALMLGCVGRLELLREIREDPDCHAALHAYVQTSGSTSTEVQVSSLLLLSLAWSSLAVAHPRSLSRPTVLSIRTTPLARSRRRT